MSNKVSKTKYLIVIVACIIWVFGFGNLLLFVTDIDIIKCNPTEEYYTSSEIESFNSQFSSYSGKQRGSSVKALIGHLIVNAKTHTLAYPFTDPGTITYDEIDMFPDIEYVKGKKINNNNEANTIYQNDTSKPKTIPNIAPSSSFNVTEDFNPEEYVKYLNDLLESIELKHYYWITTEIGKTGLINRIVIHYDLEDSSSNE